MAVANVLDLPYRIDGANRKVVYDVTGPTKYATGGISVTPAELGLNYIENADCAIQSYGEGTVNLTNAVYSKATNKILLYDETPAQVASEAEIKAPVIRITAWGK